MSIPCSILTGRNCCIPKCTNSLQIHSHRTFTRLFFIHSTDKQPRISLEYQKNLNQRREKSSQRRKVSFRRLHSLPPFERNSSVSSKYGIHLDFRVWYLINMRFRYYKQSSRVTSQPRRRKRRR